jgi:hypothetical protein
MFMSIGDRGYFKAARRRAAGRETSVSELSEAALGLVL